MINRIKRYMTRIGDEVFQTGARIYKKTPVDRDENLMPIYTAEQLGELRDGRFLVQEFSSVTPQPIGKIRPMPSNDPEIIPNLADRVMCSKHPTHIQTFREMPDGRYVMHFEEVH